MFGEQFRAGYDRLVQSLGGRHIALGNIGYDCFEVVERVRSPYDMLHAVRALASMIARTRFIAASCSMGRAAVGKRRGDLGF